MRKLSLKSSELSSLPSGLCAGLSKLRSLDLGYNNLSSVPAGTFIGLSVLTSLHLQYNAIHPMPLTVYLEKVGDGKVKAVIPTGAPLDVIVRVNVTNGSLTDGATKLTIPIGTDESSAIDVTRTLGTTEAVTVNIHRLPSPKIYNVGYEFVKASTGLPVEIYAADSGATSLIKNVTPNTTTLMSNYPNPFNPETWLPYQLSKASDVTITIYNMRGVVVRRLVLGHQKAGFYTSRRHAAYWDGRNAIGEKVAADVYFYTFKAGEFTATRKMLIRK